MTTHYLYPFPHFSLSNNASTSTSMSSSPPPLSITSSSSSSSSSTPRSFRHAPIHPSISSSQATWKHKFRQTCQLHMARSRAIQLSLLRSSSTTTTTDESKDQEEKSKMLKEYQSFKLATGIGGCDWLDPDELDFLESQMITEQQQQPSLPDDWIDEDQQLYDLWIHAQQQQSIPTTEQEKFHSLQQTDDHDKTTDTDMQVDSSSDSTTISGSPYFNDSEELEIDFEQQLAVLPLP